MNASYGLNFYIASWLLTGSGQKSPPTNLYDILDPRYSSQCKHLGSFYHS